MDAWGLKLCTTFLVLFSLNLLPCGDCSVNYTTVFIHGERGYPCIRIPAITRCRGTLHAFAECRTSIGDGCIPNTTAHHQKTTVVQPGVCYKNSSDDGVTWSNMSLVVTGGSQPTVICADNTTLILQYNMGPTNWQIMSADNGAIWSGNMGFVIGKYLWAYVGPGRGLQLSSKSVAPGRLLFIGHHGAYEYDIVWYSDDGGKTYNVSETPLEMMDEAQLVETAQGHILANMRNNHLNLSCDCRAISLSTDGGKTFGNITYDPTLISPVCMASIISMSNGSLVFANPASKSERENGTIRRSDDSGEKWTGSWEVITGSYAYSCLTHVASPQQVGLLWETGADNCYGPSCQLVFSKVTVL